MPGALSRYAFINAKLRARISLMLSEQTMAELGRAASLVEAVQLLKDTPFARIEAIYTETGDLKLAELELLKRERELFVELERYLSGPPLDLVRALGVRYEVENLKNAVRLWFDRTLRGRDVQRRTPYLLHERIAGAAGVDAVVGAETADELIQALEGTPYAQIARERAHEMVSQKSVFPMEVALDRHYYRHLLDAVARLEGRDAAIARRLVGVEIDLLNINWIVRLKNFYDLPMERALRSVIEGGHGVDEEAMRAAYSTQNVRQILAAALASSYPGLRALLGGEAATAPSRLDLVERVLEEIMRYEVRRVLGGYPFTIGIVLAYCILKQSEIRRLVTLLNAKYYGASPEKIAGLL